MEDNRRGTGVFYAVVGVATLVVAIIGATFAYFSAQATNSTDLAGTTAEASNLSLTITRVTTSQAGLIPMKDADLGKGITGETGENCVDANGNTVCHVYQIALTNGKSPVKIDGTLSFTSTSTNVVYSVLEKDLTDTKTATQLATIAGTGTTGTAFGTSATLDSGVSFNADETKYYYVAVWLKETNGAQETADANKSYTGTVTFNAAGGTGVTATFSS